MRFGLILAVVVGLSGVAGSAMAQVPNSSKALTACAKDAIKQLVLFDGVVSQKDVYGKNKKPVSNVVIFDGKHLGGKSQFKCIYNYDTEKTMIELYHGKPDTPKPPAPVGWDEVQRTCVNTAQKQNLSVDRVLGKSDQRNIKNEVISRTMVLRVFDRSKALTMDCRYDVFTGKAQLSRSNLNGK